MVKKWSNVDVYNLDFIGEINLISIKKTVEKHKNLKLLLVASHVLTGFDNAGFSK